MTQQIPTEGPESDDLDIETLFELSLAIGSSLDLKQNARTFFTRFLSRLNLSAVALYIRSGRLHDHSRDEAIYRCADSIPSFPDPGGSIPLDSPVAWRARHEGIIELSPKELDQLRPHLCAHPLDKGALVLAAHGDDILILFHCGWKVDPFQRWELSRLGMILSKFALSVETCLDHEMLVRESDRRIQLQERLIRAERLEALGLLAGGVAHDLNNLMTPLVGYPALVRNSLPANSPAHGDLDAMELAAGRAASVIDDLLVMACAGSKHTSDVGLSESISLYLRSPEFLHVRGQHPRVGFQSRLESEGDVRGSAQDLGRAIMNLIHNAFDELDQGGSIALETRDVELEVPLNGYELVPGGSYCLVRVRDDGSGIPEALLGRVFEPFVSTKILEQQGSGLGLSIVYGIVKEMGGHVDLATSASGTTVDLYLPRRGDPALPAASPPAAAQPLKGPRSILIIDDDPEHLRWAARIFEEQGVSAHVARDRETALRVSRETRPQVALIDLRLGRDDGVSLYEAIRQEQPDLRCVLVSGLPNHERVAAGLKKGAHGFLRKPFSPGELRRAVEQAL